MRAWRRILVGMKGLACMVALLTIPVAGSACGSTHHSGSPTSHPQGSVVSTKAISSSRLILGGRVRCTATVTTPVHVGGVLRVVFSVRNVSQQPVKVPLAHEDLWLVVEGADGTTYDTRRAAEATGSLGGPYIAPTTIRAGGTETRPFSYLRVRWSGPLRVTPGCEQAALPPIRVAVTTAGRPSSASMAVADVVDASGHLLDHCRPQAIGVAVTGQITPPSGDAPPMQARCSMALEPRRGFSIAQVLVVTPPSLQGMHIQEPYEKLAWLAQGRNAEAIAWEFVVTRDGAISVDSFEVDATKPGNRMAPDWNWTGSDWQGPGGSRCGGFGGGGGGAAGPMVEFITVCPS
jgi:hypothetical protein